MTEYYREIKIHLNQFRVNYWSRLGSPRDFADLAATTGVSLDYRFC